MCTPFTNWAAIELHPVKFTSVDLRNDLAARICLVGSFIVCVLQALPLNGAVTVSNRQNKRKIKTTSFTYSTLQDPLNSKHIVITPIINTMCNE